MTPTLPRHAPAGKAGQGDSRGRPYNRGMYIIAIGWLYVTVLMAATETSIVAGVLTFVFYGLAPLALLLWLLGTPARRRRAARAAALAESRADAGSDLAVAAVDEVPPR